MPARALMTTAPSPAQPVEARPKRTTGRVSDAGRVVLMGVWFALLTGLLEAIRIGVLRGLDRFTWLPADAVWMAPAAYLIYFSIPAALLFFVFLLSPRRLPLWSATFVYALISAFSLLMLVGRNRLSSWAIVLLALGIGVQAARLARSHWTGYWRLVRLGAAGMAVVTLVLFSAMYATRLTGRAGFADLPAARAGARNVLLIILDTVRAASLGLYGYNRPTTPYLEQWAGQGVVFDNAIATAPWTLPSHGSMFTGRWPHELTADWRSPLDDAQPTLAEVLRQRGYRTAAFVSNLVYTGEDSGLDRGFAYYSAHKATLKQLLLSSSLGQILIEWKLNPVFPKSDRKRAGGVSNGFLNWLSAQAGEDRPFFVFLNYFDAHLPYKAGPHFQEKLKHADRRIQGYDAAIADLDDELNRLLSELKRRGILENTLVVITSDHGELLGEHGLNEHGNSLYMPLLHVPLVMLGPAAGVPAGVRVDRQVSLRDLPRTIMQLATGDAEFPGHSLSALWQAPSSAISPLLAEVNQGIRTDPNVPVSRGPMKSLISGGFHYIRNGDGVEELYFLESDPEENRDLANTAEGRAALVRLRSELSRMLGNQVASHAASK